MKSLSARYPKEYRAYSHARWRCVKKSSCPHCGEMVYEYKDYGGRGIKFLYKSFDEFFADIGAAPGPEYSLDRIDNDGNYAPGNCRWTLKAQQQKNRGHNGKWFSMNRQNYKGE